MGKYPYKKTITDPQMLKIFHRVQKHRNAPIYDKSMSKKLGWAVKPIRKDVRITRDYSFDDASFIHLGEGVDLKINKNKLIFNKKF